MAEKPPLVTDPFEARCDPGLPSLKLALDPEAVQAEFKHRLLRLTGAEGRVHLRRMSVIRHKPGRRCVIEYRVKLLRPGAPPEKVILIGKVRARRYGNEAYRLLDAIWNAGFQTDSPDGISVPEPIGVAPKMHLWLQRKAPGKIANRLLGKPEGVALARRIADAVHKLHCAGVASERHHTMADELRILHERLPLAAQMKPALSGRIRDLLRACDRIGALVPKPRACGIHRDFYPAQVVVDGARLYLIDFDLYCLGDPGLDIGNFLAHVTEECLRAHHDPNALADREQALEDHFIALAGEEVRAAVRAYAFLSLARHVYLSTQFPERRPFTEALLGLCEKRIGAF